MKHEVSNHKVSFQLWLLVMSQYLPFSVTFPWPQLHNVVCRRAFWLSGDLWPSKLLVQGETWQVSVIISWTIRFLDFSPPWSFSSGRWSFPVSLWKWSAPSRTWQPVVQWECPHYSPLCSIWPSWQMGPRWAVHNPRGGTCWDCARSGDVLF